MHSDNSVCGKEDVALSHPEQVNRDALPGLERLHAGRKWRTNLNPVDSDEDTVGGSGTTRQSAVGYLGLGLRRREAGKRKAQMDLTALPKAQEEAYPRHRCLESGG